MSAPRKWVLECPIDTPPEVVESARQAFLDFLDQPDKRVCVLAGIVVKEVSK